MSRWAVGILVVAAVEVTFAAEPGRRTLDFEERVHAQELIERVSYSHQLGTTTPFEEAVPRSALEAKVRRYLEQSAALELYWNEPITDESLQRELERMARSTRMPERLLELYVALGSDAFVIKECLARSVLVERLSRNFYEFDTARHAASRAVAEALAAQVSSGALSAAAEHPNRTAVRIVASASADPATDDGPFERRLPRDEFIRQRAELPARAGQPSTLQEDAEGFSFSVLLAEDADQRRIATYRTPKVSWDTWWRDAREAVSAVSVPAVASTTTPLPRPSVRAPGSALACPGDDTWDQWTLRQVPYPRRGHTAVWTGTNVLIWGGQIFSGEVNTGSRYDPVTDSWLSMSLIGAPSGRTLHRAVWTGSSMVVWGGRRVSNVFFGDGGRYDPVSDSWLPTSNVGAPSSRSNFTAIWTGSSMVVWGGTNGSAITASGGRYDPASDTWLPVSATNAPVARSGHTAVWTGSRMIMWGGSGTGVASTGGQYDPVGDVWTATSNVNAPAARSGHLAFWTGSVMVVWGGSSLTTGGRYDPVSDTWVATSLTNAPAARSGYAGAWTGTSMIVFGGSVFDEPTQTFLYSNDGRRYDPASDVWTATSLVGAPQGRTNHTMVWTGSSVMLWGGSRLEGINLDTNYLDTGARYDPLSNTWTPTSLTGTPRARYSHTAVWTGNVMVIWGGSNGNFYLDQGGRYDPVTDDWSTTATAGAPLARVVHSAVWTGTKMIVWGGGSSLAPPPDYTFNNGAAYDPIANTWSPVSTLGAPSPRAAHAAAWTGSGMLVWGGENNGQYPSTGGRYDPASNTWTPMTTVGTPQGRRNSTAVWAGRYLVVWGGTPGSSMPFLNTGGRYDPVEDQWLPTALVGAPSPRSFHRADWTGHSMVVWGGLAGSGGAWLGNGGRYDPIADAWTPISGVGAPSPRGDHASVWTGREVVVWGGYGGTFLNTGARYDPAADVWTPTSTIGALSARESASAVWNGHEMMIWGGYENASPFILVDTGGSYRVTPGESCNGIDDDCDGLIDENGTTLCDDGNPCSDDACNGVNGCHHSNNTVACDDANPCTGTDTCGNGSCAGTPLEGTPCSDGSTCTLNDACSGGACVPGVPRNCGDGNACTDDVCDPLTGCSSSPRNCDDNNVCTTDGCSISSGCINGPVAGACNDGNNCTNDETCINGQCLSPTVLCDDGNPCTDDICQSWGCQHNNNAAPCNDGYSCTVNDVCAFGSCAGTPTDGAPCNDGDACTSGDTCNGPYCSGNYLNCNDGNPCTGDWCDPQTGECAPYDDDTSGCSDGNECTVSDRCQSGVCIPGEAVNCFDVCPPWMETVGEYCRQTIRMNGDYLFNQYQACDLFGLNRYNDCENEYGFTFGDSGWNLMAIDVDFQFVSGTRCEGGTSTVSLNGEVIGSFDAAESCFCYPTTQVRYFPNITTSFYHAGDINTFSIVPAGGCEGLSPGLGPTSQDYAILTVTYARHHPDCGTGQCVPETGRCEYVTVPDGSACGGVCRPEGGTCDKGTCDGPAIDCNDGNPCTDDFCDSLTGCVHVANTDACDDGNACSTGDVCGGGVCAGTMGPVPPEVSQLWMHQMDEATVLIWDASIPGLNYDVLRGMLSDLPVGSSAGMETCFNDVGYYSISDFTVPAPGSGYWYLPRAFNVCGNGPYGWQDTNGVHTAPRVSATCP